MSRPERTGYCNRHRVAVVDGSCIYCDDENPIMKRTFVVEVSTPFNNLTDNGEFSEPEGWRFLEGQIKADIQAPHTMGWSLEFIQWDPDIINLIEDQTP